jgi:hypothetical protein
MVFSRPVRGCSLAVLVLSSSLLLGATATSAQTASAGAQMIGYKTPNIDRIAHEGALFADYCSRVPFPEEKS